MLRFYCEVFIGLMHAEFFIFHLLYITFAIFIIFKCVVQCALDRYFYLFYVLCIILPVLSLVMFIYFE